jgi:transposase
MPITPKTGSLFHAFPHKLDPFKSYVMERVGAAAPEAIPASVLLMELRERGYPGGYTMLKLFVASLRPKQAVEPVIRFETGPGEQMQVDWAVIRRGENRLSVFVATLGWSRASYVEFVTDERVETLIEAHENAFLAFGGTPREVTQWIQLPRRAPLPPNRGSLACRTALWRSCSWHFYKCGQIRLDLQ